MHTNKNKRESYFCVMALPQVLSSSIWVAVDGYGSTIRMADTSTDTLQCQI